MSVIGVDPGLGGAMARYELSTGELDIFDMPTWTVMVGKTNRRRVDPVALHEYFEMAKMLGVELVMIEAVGGRGKQSASAGFTFGYTVGLIYMACVSTRLPIEAVPPQTWKHIMKVPGKRLLLEDGKSVDGAIINRADQLMPEHRDKWRGPNGGRMVDRAEASLIAKFAAEHALDATRKAKLSDEEFRKMYVLDSKRIV